MHKKCAYKLLYIDLKSLEVIKTLKCVVDTKKKHHSKQCCVISASKIRNIFKLLDSLWSAEAIAIVPLANLR